MGTHNQRLKFLMFGLASGESPDEVDFFFQCQVENWQVVNNTPDGNKRFSYCYDPELSDAENFAQTEFREDADPDFQLTADLYADWRNNGISTFAWQHDGQTLAFRIDHLPHIPDEHVRWDGFVKIKAPSVGGAARATEMSAIAWPIIGMPNFTPADELS